MNIKLNDNVVVLSGKDKGKKSIIVEIFPKKGKVRVKDVAVVVRHTKPKKQGDKAGILRIESKIDSSKVLPICSSCKNPTRVGYKKIDDKKYRICRHCKEVM